MARARGTKQIAQRVDFSYLKQRQPLLVARRWLCVGAVLVVSAWFLIAGVRWDLDKPRIVGMLYNPGPVSDAHAYFESNCALCHSGDGKGGFTREVTDQACLTCHDGAIHHSNQAIGDFRVDDPSHPHKMRSSDCKACHVEHRGRPALAATSDRHCLVCHKNLSSPQHAINAPKVHPNITAFDEHSHPKFGRRLLTNGTWFDPTPLRFNHEKHFDQSALKQSDCILCHAPFDQTHATTQPTFSKTLLPPYASEKHPSPFATPAPATDRRYMQPIRFDQHCYNCHRDTFLPASIQASLTREERNRDVEIEFQPSLTAERVPHEDLTIVRTHLEAALHRVLAQPSSNFTSTRNGQITEVTRQDWLTATAEALVEQINAILSEDDFKDAGYRNSEVELIADQASPQDVVNYYTTYVALTGCVKCHDLMGKLPSPGAETFDLRTKPTGIGPLPRRWFAASQFNHDAHRNLKCIDCHPAAVKSALTSDVLLPDMTTLTSDQQSCVTCHQPPGAAMRSAPGACVTCHFFHDRTHERLTETSAIQPATMAVD